ncbi:MAG TPA: hypothetical protein VF865_16610 [Acidobacteriaceae bacterium]
MFPIPRLRAFSPASSLIMFGLLSLAPVALAAGRDVPLPPDLSARLNQLADQPATHTGVTFDRSMMQVAESVLQQGGLDADRAAAALTSISFDTYRFKEPAFYTPEMMESIVRDFHRAGWKHLVNGNQTPANMAQPRTSITDVWLHFSGADIDHVTVLVRGAKDMNLVQVAGELRPLDLIHLSGHFGIPKVDPNAVMVPAPDGR